MLRRTERRLRQLLKEIDTCLDALEVESELINRKKTSKSNDLSSVERVTSKLKELALAIEFELHLKRTSGVILQSHGDIDTEVEEPCERTKEQVERTAHLAKPKATSHPLSTLETRLDERFGPISDEPEA